MSDQLGQLLGYFDSDGVTELVIHTGQPIHVRVHGEYRAVTEGAVSKPQLAHLMLGTPLDALTPEDERNSESRKLVLEGRAMHALLIKRGKEISLTIATSPPDSAPMPQYSSQITKPARPTSNTIAPMKPTAAAPVATPAAAPPPTPPAIPKPSPLPPKPPRTRDESAAPAQIRSAPPKDDPPPARLKLELDDEEHESTSVGVAIPVAPPVVAPVMKPSPVAAATPPVGVKFNAPAPVRAKPPTPAPPPEPEPPPQRLPRAVSIAELDDDSDVPDLDTGLPRGVTQDISARIGENWVPELEPAIPRKAKDEKSAPRAMPSLSTASRGTAASSPAEWQGGSISAFEPDDSISLPLETEARFEPPPAAMFEPPPVAAPKFEPPAPKFEPPPAVAAAAPVISTVGGLVDEPVTVSPILAKIVQAARAANASDLHIAANRPLLIRTMSELKPLDGKVVAPSEVEAVLMPLLGPMRRKVLQERGYVDLAVEVPNAGRLRTNISRIQGGLKGAFRLSLPRPFTLEELALPKDLAKVVHHHQGLVVIAGPSGHGKTTTLAALVDLVNGSRPHHILTVEDPVEIEHPRKAAVVSQREVGKHTKSFAAALKASLREDPDVIVIGELRDRETVEIALTAAETGHLVIATMSTPSAAKTIDRLIDMFPPDDQSQVRASLAGALRAIVAQRLVPTKDGKILPAVELLSGCLPLSVLIRDNKLFQLPNLMQRGRSLGMIRLDESLLDLFRKGKISDETALALADAKKEMTNAVRGPAATPIPKVVK